jgi:acyl-CoA hydrolase
MTEAATARPALRGAPVTVRYGRMLAVAHPEHRAALAAELEEHLMNGALR